MTKTKLVAFANNNHHERINVYQVLKSGEPMRYKYSVRKGTNIEDDGGWRGAFDVRDLPGYITNIEDEPAALRGFLVRQIHAGNLNGPVSTCK